MAVFLVKSLIAPVNQTELLEAYEQVRIEYKANDAQTDKLNTPKQIFRQPSLQVK